jgi:hypothetical protein
MTTKTEKSTKPVRVRKSDENLKQVNIRVPLDIYAQMRDYVANAPVSLRKAIDAATLAPSGKPHESADQAFVAYAIRQLLSKNAAPRVFGSKIEEDVAEIMEQNIEAFERNPLEWWNLTAIGSSLLRDKGHNPNSVKRWIEENNARLIEHHTQVGITDPAAHNRRAGKARKVANQ